MDIVIIQMLKKTQIDITNQYYLFIFLLTDIAFALSKDTVSYCICVFYACS